MGAVEVGWSDGKKERNFVFHLAGGVLGLGAEADRKNSMERDRPTQRRAEPIPARTEKRIQEECSTPGVVSGVIQKPNPRATKSPIAEPRKKHVEFSFARLSWEAISRPRTKTSGLKRTTIPKEKASARVV